MEKTPCISVIVPVYQVERFIRKCLDSLLSQTFKDFEVILVDDGSTDESAKICDDFCLNDSRFHVIHKKNGGVSSARNIGLKYAIGEWITFVDSDDTVDQDYLLKLHQATVGNGNEILVVQGLKIINSNSSIELRVFENQRYETENMYLVFQELHINKFGYIAGKLYRNQIIQQEHIQFDENIYFAEDLLFMLSYMHYITVLQTIDGSGYNYYMYSNQDSLSNPQRFFSFESEYACCLLYLSKIETLKNKFHIQQEALLDVYNTISGYLMIRAVKSLYLKDFRKSKTERISILKKMANEQIDFLGNYNEYCSWYHRVIIFFLSKRLYSCSDCFNCFLSMGRVLKLWILRQL
ncbi:glycosyltransferase family 2 protein [Parabacteroides merdae]|jgi:hypothetical protein|uniref:glycosyltransferase family 2 protein n=1 Tax=Parabacteroides merdae TaxID=46503 RepID=UPI0034A112E2